MGPQTPCSLYSQHRSLRSHWCHSGFVENPESTLAYSADTCSGSLEPLNNIHKTWVRRWWGVTRHDICCRTFFQTAAEGHNHFQIRCFHLFLYSHRGLLSATSVNQSIVHRCIQQDTDALFNREHSFITFPKEKLEKANKGLQFFRLAGFPKIQDIIDSAMCSSRLVSSIESCSQIVN